MEHEKLMNSDLMKFYLYLVSGDKNNLDFQDPMYYEFVKINEKEIPVEEYGNEDYVLEDWDDVLQCGVNYKDMGTIWYDEYIIEEDDDNVFDYADLEFHPVALTLTKPGTIIFSPEITIGNKVDFDTVCKVFDGAANGNIGSGELQENTIIIECKMEEFSLELDVVNDILAKATIFAISNN